MPHDGANNSFDFLDEHGDGRILLRPKRRGGPPRWLAPIVAIAIGGAVVGLVLHRDRILRILEGETSTVAVAPKPPVPPGPPAAFASSSGTRALAGPMGNRKLPQTGGVLRVPARPPAEGRPRLAANDPDLDRAKTSLEGKRDSSGSDAGAGDGPSAVGHDQAVAFLEARGIVRVGARFILKSEPEAANKLASLKTQADRFNGADRRLADIKQDLAHLDRLDQTIINVNGELADLSSMMGKYTPIWRGGILYHGVNSVQSTEYEALKGEHDRRVRYRDVELVPQRNTLRLQRPGRDLDEATRDLKYKRQGAAGALVELKEAVEATKKGYLNLSGDREVGRNLTSVGQSSLEPSPGFLEVDRLCREFERSAGRLGLTTGR